MPDISQKMAAVPASGIRKFFDIVSQMDDVISLGVGEPDFVTPWRIREACIYSLEKGYTTYTSNYGLLELRELVAQNLQNCYGLTYNPQNQILITVGVSEAIDLALRAILNPGDEVIIPEPCFVAYKPCVIFAGGKPVSIPTNAESGFIPTSTQIEAAITPKTKAILISYPNNPTGAVMPRETLQEIMDVAVRYDLWVISDEIYDKLVYDVEHTCIPTLAGAYERTILLNGWSKAYAMTGWRIGFAASTPGIIETMMKIHQYVMMCAPITAQMAAIEALKNGEADANKMIREYDRRRRLIFRGLNNIGLACLEPKGAFYVFPSIKKTGLSSEEFAERLLREEKVVVVPGNTFGECGEGYVRCSYATSISNIQQALERIERFVNKFSG
ncbi:MAG: aminotransferase class I/II-fold pyridoxal phosphate-dependent enzyme [Armatimonadota bacterium]|nr:aminotransferase class I/II-fold pyridoxal phosphate-dependent enzyme [Armatimonadota bacterium]